MLVINESDLYRLVFKSSLPSAELFTDWVTSEVLPSIRKTGGYIVGQDSLSEDALIEKALQVVARRMEEQGAINAWNTRYDERDD